MQSTSSLHSLSSCSPILLVRHYIQDCHVQKVTVHAGVLLSDATALSSPLSPDIVLGERVLRMLISCPECHIIPLTRSVFMFGTIEDTPSIIRMGCKRIYIYGQSSPISQDCYSLRAEFVRYVRAELSPTGRVVLGPSCPGIFLSYVCGKRVFFNDVRLQRRQHNDPRLAPLLARAIFTQIRQKHGHLRTLYSPCLHVVVF